MSWLSLALALLKFANLILDRARTQTDIQAGVDKQVAEEAVAVLRNTKFGKAIAEKIDAMSGDSVDDLLAKLGSDANK